MSRTPVEILQNLVPPAGVGVIQGSTPVISFGDYIKAKAVTLGINPSSNEFKSGDNFIAQGKKRLVDFEALGTSAQFPLNPEQAEKVWQGSRDYFAGPNAYWTWFSHLESILNVIGLSYKDNSAAHLDLSPWATDPIWSGLSKEQQASLIADGKDLLWEQSKGSNFRTIIFNGSEAADTISSYANMYLSVDQELEYTSGGKKRSSKLYLGDGPQGQAVFGWSLNLQAMQATADERTFVMKAIGYWLEEKVSGMTQNFPR